jgi:peptide/nickel transport system substrate-binding protein
MERLALRRDDRIVTASSSVAICTPTDQPPYLPEIHPMLALPAEPTIPTGGSRSGRRSHRALAIATAVFALVAIAACSAKGEGSSDVGSGRADTIRGALATTVNPDPDVYFALEGVMITSAVYDPLVRQVGDTQDVEGVLAESWTVSDDGLTYTFTLRDGLRFSDGSDLTAPDLVASFQRRIDLQELPSIMLAGVAGFDAPDDSTFVVTLAAPDHGFLLRLGSAWGPVATNPEVIAQNAGSDHASTYLRTHGAGSGPYVIESMDADSGAVLVRNENYWGDAAPTERIELPVVSSASTAQLQVEQGDLDFAQYVSPDTATKLSDSDQVSLFTSSAFNMAMYQVNTARVPFDDPAFRSAVVGAIPFDEIVDDVYGNWGSPADSYGPAAITADDVPFDPPQDPAALRSAVAALPAEVRSSTVTLGYLGTDSGGQARVTAIVGDVLRTAGLTVEEVPMTEAQFVSLFTDPQSGPHMALTVQPADGGGPDNWFRAFYSTAGSLNWNGAGTSEGDAIIDAANSTPWNQPYPLADLNALSGILDAQLATFPVANVDNIWVVSPVLSGMATPLGDPQALVLSQLKLGSG